MEKAYYPVSLGHNCIPAYHLGRLGLRKESFPFDWLATAPCLGLEYVTDLIDSYFSCFLSDLEYDDQHYVFPAKYPKMKFIHHDLIANKILHEPMKMAENSSLILTFEKRTRRFLSKLNESGIFFIYCFAYEDTKLDKCTYLFYESIKKFVNLMKNREVDFKLLIIIYDNDDFDLNSVNIYHNLCCNIYIRKFVRDVNINPYFGDTSAFEEVLKEFIDIDDHHEDGYREGSFD